jgi:hypothetical protein
MKFLVANLLTLLALASMGIWPLWTLLEVHWAAKVGLSLVVVIASGFIEERFLSRFVNKLVVWLLPDQKR